MYKNDIMEKETTGRRYVPPMMRVVSLMGNGGFMDDVTLSVQPGVDDDDSDKVKAWRDDFEPSWEESSTTSHTGGLWDKAW